MQKGLGELLGVVIARKQRGTTRGPHAVHSAAPPSAIVNLVLNVDRSKAGHPRASNGWYVALVFIPL
jgi:hypothetical protein